MKRREYTTVEISKVLQKEWLGIDDVIRIAPISIKQAGALCAEIYDEMVGEGKPYLRRRPYMVPRERVLQKLGISYHEEIIER